MNNKIDGIIVDAGHGGLDGGAVGNNLKEKDLTLRAAKYIYNRLNELGIPAKLVREDDEYLPKQDRIKRVLSLYNNSPNTILLSNHINAGGAEGAEVVYSLKNSPMLANLVLENIGEKGQLKRKVYQRRLPENPNKDYYYILRESGNTEPILIEYGFIDNKNDAAKLNNNIENYAEGVVKALCEYIGYPYQEQQTSTEPYYIVKKDDTLYSISKRFNIPVEEIKRINNLNSNTLQIGQKLYLTDNQQESTNTKKYIVKRGDTLYSIAFNNDTTVDEIKRLNNLQNNNISINQELLIPIVEEEIIDENEPIIEDYDIYKVKKNDSLWSIANKYNITIPKLLELNNLTDLTIYVDQELKVPKTDTTNNYYTVKKGDTLWSIAKENNISVNELKELNNLKDNLLTIGEQLIIQ
ncbi:MAG: LysM peptidoglycan-binding domain-containing protein [Bacilli bacterium]|nr:LysM peptidoglycan-binding domain-containing protein [Bacilli bacterium]